MGWLFFDLMSSFPFYLLFGDSSSINDYARLSKIPKIMRIFRLAKMIKVLRLFKAKKKYMETITTYMKIRPSLERIFSTFIISFIVFHIVACFWHLTTGKIIFLPLLMEVIYLLSSL